MFASLVISLVVLAGDSSCFSQLSEFGRGLIQKIIPFSEDADWEIIESLGRGGNGEVFKIRHRRSEAIRVFKTALNGEVFWSNLDQERKNYEKFNRWKIPRLAEFYRETNLTVPLEGGGRRRRGIMIEFIEGQNMLEFLEQFYQGSSAINFFHQDRRIFLTQYLLYLLQVVDFLEGVHHHGYVAMDMNPKNFMIFNHGVKIIDPAQVMSQKDLQKRNPKSGITASPPYFSGDDIDDRAITTNFDYFSLGVIVFEAFALSLRKEDYLHKFRKLAHPKLENREILEVLSEVQLFEDESQNAEVKGLLLEFLNSRDRRVQSAEEARMQLRRLIAAVNISH